MKGKIAPLLYLLVISFALSVVISLLLKPDSTFAKKPHTLETKIEKSTEIATSASLLKIQPVKPSPTPEVLKGFCLKVPVLFYHHIQPYQSAKEKGQTSLSVDNKIFEGQMAYLVSRGYQTITVKQLVDALRNHLSLPSKSIIITLDDGYRDAYEFAYPIFQKYHITANLAIATGLLGGANYMSWGQVEEMVRSGLAYPVDHTWSHASLVNLSADKATYEVNTAKQQLEQHTGQKIDTFVYPYGTLNDNVVKILQQNGFLGAFSTIPGFFQCDSFIMSLHRNRVGNAQLSSYVL